MKSCNYCYCLPGIQDPFSIHKHVLFSSLSIHVFYNENVEFIDEKIQKQVSWFASVEDTLQMYYEG
jgi:hypothetical protein